MGNCLPIFDSAWRKANAAMKVAEFAFAYYSQGTRLGAGTLTERFGLAGKLRIPSRPIREHWATFR